MVSKSIWPSFLGGYRVLNDILNITNSIFNNRRTFFQYNCTLIIMSMAAYLPVVVHVAQLVGEPLHMIRLQSAGVVHNIVVGWGDTSWADRLAHNVEVIPGKQRLQQLMTKYINGKIQERLRHVPLWTSDLWVNDGAWGRVGHLAIDVGKEPAADALLYHHHTQLGPMMSKIETLHQKPFPKSSELCLYSFGVWTPPLNQTKAESISSSVDDLPHFSAPAVLSVSHNSLLVQQLFKRKTLDIKNSHIIMPHGLDGVYDLWNLIVNHAVQLAVAYSISIHNDAWRQAVVELQIVFQCSWEKKVILRLLTENYCVY